MKWKIINKKQGILGLFILFILGFIIINNTDIGFNQEKTEITPFNLSNQVHEYLIKISKAEHLDENKQFISDIYNEVYQLDDVWSETINNNEYVRVTFEQKLTNKNDIAIYLKIISGEPKIEVYEVNGIEKIAEFTSLNSNQNKIFLTNLIGEQDTFDLRIIGGIIQIDYIIDAPQTVQVIPTDSDYAHIGTSSGSCAIAAINFSEDIDCSLVTMDGGDTGYINITHASSIPDGSTMGDVFACIEFQMTTKTEDVGDGPLTIEIGYNDGGVTWNSSYLNVSEAAIVDYQAENTHCWNVTNFINTETKAEDVLIRITYSEGGSPNQGMHVDFSNITITYDPPASADSCTAPTTGNWALVCSHNCNWTSDFSVPANITINESGRLTLKANMTMNATIPWQIYKDDGCELIINPEGGIN